MDGRQGVLDGREADFGVCGGKGIGKDQVFGVVVEGLAAQLDAYRRSGRVAIHLILPRGGVLDGRWVEQGVDGLGLGGREHADAGPCVYNVGSVAGTGGGVVELESFDFGQVKSADRCVWSRLDRGGGNDTIGCVDVWVVQARNPAQSHESTTYCASAECHCKDWFRQLVVEDSRDQRVIWLRSAGRAGRISLAHYVLEGISAWICVRVVGIAKSDEATDIALRVIAKGSIAQGADQLLRNRHTAEHKLAVSKRSIGCLAIPEATIEIHRSLLKSLVKDVSWSRVAALGLKYGLVSKQVRAVCIFG